MQEVPAAYRTQLLDALVAALVQALVAWTGSPRQTLELEGHGREPLSSPLDVSRTLGWFTTFFPVSFDLTGTQGPGGILERVKERLRRMPGRGLPYGLLKHQRPDLRGRLDTRVPEVAFNFLGQLDLALPETAPFGPAPGSIGPTESPRQLRRWPLNVNAQVHGGELQATFTYSENLHARATIERLAQDFVGALRELITHCRQPEAGRATPSDFPLARLDNPTLARLLGNAREVEDLYPLAPLQAGLLYQAVAAAPGDDPYFEPLSCRLEGDLDSGALEAAWRRVTERHPALRTAFHWEGLAEPLQAVLRREALIETFDWTGAPKTEHSERLAAWSAGDRRRGFDLRQVPLRLALFRLGPATYSLHLSFHHILLDGWSLALVLQELFALYRANVDGGEAELFAVRPYRDYVVWASSQDTARTASFWRRNLAGLRLPTPLPADRLAPVASAGRQDFHVVRHGIDGQPFAALSGLARRLRVTFNTLLQGAWALLLSRASGEDVVLFGAVSAGRPAALPGVESMVGLFINTLPLRVALPAAGRLPAWLAEIQAKNVEAPRLRAQPSDRGPGVVRDRPHPTSLREHRAVRQLPHRGWPAPRRSARGARCPLPGGQPLPARPPGSGARAARPRS